LFALSRNKLHFANCSGDPSAGTPGLPPEQFAKKKMHSVLPLVFFVRGERKKRLENLAKQEGALPLHPSRDLHPAPSTKINVWSFEKNNFFDLAKAF
jgi:hypothetical protein